MVRTLCARLHAVMYVSLAVLCLQSTQCLAEGPSGLSPERYKTTLLDEVGRFSVQVSADEYSSWKRELKLSGPRPQSAALLHV